MLSQPSSIWSWWRNRSFFLKILWFLPVLIALVLVFCVYVFLRKDIKVVDEIGNQSKKAKDKHEEFYEKIMKGVEEEDREITKKINTEREKRKHLNEKKAIRELESRKTHEAINNATTFDDVDRALDADARRRKASRRRNDS